MTKFDPNKIFVGTRLFKDTDDRGTVITDENTNEWKDGELVIELYDTKTGKTVATHKERTTRNKYAVWQEDFTALSKEEIVAKYFEGVQVSEASESELDKAARESQVATAEAKLAEALARIADLEKEAEARDEIDQGAFEAPADAPVEEVVEDKPVEDKGDQPKKTKKSK